MQNNGFTHPNHIPESMVLDVSYEQFTMAGDDPFVTVSRLHDGPGIYWTPNIQFGEPGWLISRHDYVREAFTNWEVFSSDYRALQALGITWKFNPLEFDPPEHTHYRQILSPHFSPASVQKMDAAVRASCDQLIAGFETKGGCEFISEFGELFPSYVFLDLMGMPKSKLPDFLAWERIILRSHDPQQRVGAMMEILNYLEQFLAEQQSQPGTELFQSLLSARYNHERPLSKDDLMGMCYLLYIAGLDTIYSVVGWIFRHLAGDQTLQQRLRDNPKEIPKAVEEFLRAFGVASPTRRVRVDTNFYGAPFKAGEIIKLSTPAAGRDPTVYENPHTINIDRNARYLTFGSGPHICLGMNLARRELKTVIEAFLTRFNNIRMPQGEQYSFHTGGVFGVDRLPLIWD